MLSLEDQLEAVMDELEYLYRRQREADRADLDHRVANRAVWRDAIDERAQRIRVLERERARLERERARLRMSMFEVDAA